MNTITESAEYAEWLATRPLAVQARAKQYPAGTRWGDAEWVCGYWEDTAGGVGIFVTSIPPEQTYDRYAEMERTKRNICSDCLGPLPPEETP